LEYQQCGQVIMNIRSWRKYHWLRHALL